MCAVTTDKFFSRISANQENDNEEDTTRVYRRPETYKSRSPQAQLQIVKDLERRKQSAAAVQLLIDSVDARCCLGLG